MTTAEEAKENGNIEYSGFATFSFFWGGEGRMDFNTFVFMIVVYDVVIPSILYEVCVYSGK